MLLTPGIDKLCLVAKVAFDGDPATLKEFRKKVESRGRRVPPPPAMVRAPAANDEPAKVKVAQANRERSLGRRGAR